MKKMLVTVVAVIALVVSPMAVMADQTNVNSSTINEADNAASANVGEVGSSSGAVIDNSGQDNSVRGGNGPRYLPNAGVTPIPGTNGFFTAPTPDSSYRDMIEFLRFAGPIFSEGAFEEMKKGADLESNFQMFNTANRVKRADAIVNEGEETPIRYVKVVIDRNGNIAKEGDIRFFAAVDAEADDEETNSVQVLANMGDACADAGGNILVLTKQNAHRRVFASGWGIGFYTVGSQVSSGGQTAGLVGGGTGFAKNRTGPEDMPWLHGYCGVRANPVLPDLPNAGRMTKK